MDTILLNHIEAAKEYIKKTKRLHNHNKKEFMFDEKTHFAVSMTLFTVLNEIIDIGETIIEKEGFKIPLNYKEIFIVLRNEGVISLEIGKSLEEYCKLRNMIAHQYANLDLEKVYDLAENLEIFESFIEEVLFYFKNK